ncbi:hypothetical protein DYB32_009879, partial [Aphanomyces invadans]
RDAALDSALVREVLKCRGILRLVCQFQDGLDAKLHALVEDYTSMPPHNEAFIVEAMLTLRLSSSRPHSRRNLHANNKLVSTSLKTCDPLAVVKTLYRFRRQEVFTSSCLLYLAKQGHLRVLAFLHSAGCRSFTPQVMDAAAQYGHLSLVQFLHTHRTDGCTVAALDGAARRGHMELVHFLHIHRNEGCSPAAIDGAAANGHLEIVQYLHANFPALCDIESALKLATEKGHIDIVRFLHELNGGSNVLKVLVWAARKGHLNIIKYMQATHEEAFVRFNHHVMYTASERGHTAIVEYLSSGEATT